MPYVDLQRRFLALADDREETLARIETARLFGHDDAGWSDVLACPRAVVLAEAGAGKTVELRAQRDRLRAEGAFVVVLPVVELAEAGPEACCTPDELAAFEAWRAAAPFEGSESVPRGWFFLDAVDEAKLTGKRFSTALNKLAHALGPARDRAHVVITSRVTDWRPGADLREVAERLPPPRDAADPAADAPLDVFAEEGSDASRPPSDDEPRPPEGVRVFALAPLRREQVERLARDGAGLADADAFLRALDEADLWDLVARPLDALDLAQFWREHRRLESRARTLDWIVDKRLSERNETHERVAGAPAPANARRLAGRLAAALTFARRRTIALPDADPSFAGTESIDPAEVLPDLTAPERPRLLSTALFDPASYGRARFHHREVEEFLTAEWLHARLEAGMAHSAVLDLLLPTSAGLRVAPPTLRPALAWLALRDDVVFDAALQHAPAVLLQHGDPGSLPLPQRERLLEAYAETVGREPWADVSFTVVARLAKPDLADAIRRLWPPGVARSALRDLSTILIGRGRIAGCVDLVVDLAIARDADEISRAYAIDAVARVDHVESIAAVTRALAAEGAGAPWRVAAEAIEELFPRRMSVSDCLALLPALREKPDGYIGKIDAGLVGKADAAIPMRDLRAFAHGLAGFLKTKTNRGFRRILLALLAPVATRLARELTAFHEADAEAIALAMSRREYGSALEAEQAALDAAVAARPELRAALFRAAIELQVEVNDDTPDIFWQLEDGIYAAADIGWLSEMLGRTETARLRSAALRALLRIWRREPEEVSLASLTECVGDSTDLLDTIATWTAPGPSESARSLRERMAENERRRAQAEAARAASRTQLRHDLVTALRVPAFSADAPLGDGDRLLVAAWRVMRRRESAAVPRDWRAFEGALGDEAACRLRDVFAVRWRSWRIALRAEGREGRRYGDSIAATGLAIELDQDAGLVSRLDHTEAEQALRIALFENLDGELALAPLTARHGDLARDLLQRELRHCVALDDASLLSGLADARKAPFVALVADDLLSTLEARADLPPGMRAAIVDALSIAPQPSRTQLGRLARARLSATVTEADARFWWRTAFACDAPAAFVRLEAELSHTDPVGCCGLMRCVLPAVHARQDALTLGFAANADRLPILSRLVERAFEHTPPAAYPDHWNRPGFGDDDDGGWRPTPEVEVGDAREALFGALAALPGAETVAALLALADRFAGEPFADRFRRAAHQRAGADAEPGWAARDVVEVERVQDLVPRTGDGLFALISRRLEGIARDFVDGDSSHGPLLALLDHPPGADKDHRPRQREAKVQHWVAMQLRDRARERYTVVREAEVAEQKEPDILVVGRNGPPAEVAVEIKIADDWTIRELEDALLLQLSGLYLRPAHRRHGVLLLVRLDPARTWREPGSGDETTFVDLETRLAALARETRANASGAVTLAIRTIDAARFVEKARALKAKAAGRRKGPKGGQSA